jgi:oligopeptide transport system ATP-binding protein
MRLIASPPGRIAEGQILFDGKDLARLSEAKMRYIRGNRISMIFQEPMTALNPVIRVGFQVAESLQLHKKLPKAQALKKAVEMLANVGIPDPENRALNYPHQMSGGMRQRVMIAMALSCNPELLIADEPTTALDVTIQAQIIYLMNKLKEKTGTSILLITHDMGVIAEMAQTVAVMYAGRIVEHAEAGELFKNPSHPYTRGLLNSIPKLNEPVPADRKLQSIPGTVPNLLELDSGCSYRNRCPLATQHCDSNMPFLREIGDDHLVSCFYAK